jgi:hypothetical protein
MSENSDSVAGRDNDRLAGRDSDSVANRDREIEETDEAPSSSAVRLFDIRRVIGGLFTLYGVLVLGAGIVDGSSASKKAAGIDINVWTGIAMLVFGLLMLLWMMLSPSAVGAANDDAHEGRPAHE